MNFSLRVAALVAAVPLTMLQPANSAPVIELVVPASAAPTPAPQQPRAATEAPVVGNGEKAIYILVTTGDASLATAISLELARNLTTKIASGAIASADSPVIVPEPAWTQADLAKQCSADGNTRGAIVVGPVENDTGNSNYVVYLHGYTKLTATVAMAGCEPTAQPKKTPSGIVPIAAAPAGNLQTEWSSRDLVGGDGKQGGISLLPLAVAGALFAYHIPTITQPPTVTTTNNPANNPQVATTTGTANMNGTTTTTGGGSVAQSSLGWTNNASTFGSDLGTIATNLQSLTTTQLPGVNSSTLVSRAAFTIAGNIGEQVRATCAAARADYAHQKEERLNAELMGQQYKIKVTPALQACLRVFSGKEPKT